MVLKKEPEGRGMLLKIGEPVLEKKRKKRGQVSTFNTKEEPKGFKICDIEVRAWGRLLRSKRKQGRV
jgi:hypothetical protein